MGNAVRQKLLQYTDVEISPCSSHFFLIFWGFVFLLSKTFKLLRVPTCWTLRVIQKRTVLTKLDIYVFIVNKQNEIVSKMKYCYDKII